MKKIILSALFMSVISMADFAGAQEQVLNDVQFIKHPGIAGGEVQIERNFSMNVVQYERFIDFINAMRNTINPNTGEPYVEGQLTAFLKNNIATNVHEHIANHNIDRYDHFVIVCRIPNIDQQEAAELPAQDEDADNDDSEVIELLDDDNDSDLDDDDSVEDENFAYQA